MAEKSIFKNYIFNAAYTILNMLVSIITIPHVSRVLMPEGVGQVAYAQNIVSYFTLIASLGIPNYGIREIAKNNKTIESRSKVFFEIFIINSISTIFALVCYYLCIIKNEYFVDKKMYAIAGVALFLNFINIDWLYRGIEEFQYITVRNGIIKILSMVCIWMFVNSQQDIYLYVWIVAITNGANYIFNILHVKKILVWVKISSLQIRRHFKVIFLLFATAVAVEIYAQMDITMIGLICGDTNVGYYSNTVKITRIITVAITAIGGVLLPRLSVYYQEKTLDRIKVLINKTILFILFISIPCMAGLLQVSDDLVCVFLGEAFMPAASTLRILSLLIPILSIGNIYGTQLMMVFGMEKFLTVTVLLGAVVNMVLNSFLIPVYQQNGAATASVITECIVMVSQYLFTRKYIKTTLHKSMIFKIIIQTSSMMLAVALVHRLDVGTIARLFLSIAVGGFVYIVVGFAIRNTLMKEIWNKIF